MSALEAGAGEAERDVEPGRAVAPEREQETTKERLTYWAYRSAEWLAANLPERAGRRLFLAFGRLAYRALHGVRATVEANQSRVLGLDPGSDLAATVCKEAFDLYARYWFDTFRLPALSGKAIDERFLAEGIENLDEALAGGHGAITVLPHMGNWDAAGRWLAQNGYRIAAVAEELRPRRLFELFLEHREKLGMKIVPLSPTAHVGQQLAALLAQNWIVALVADRDLSGRGIEVEMFGATRTLPAGPALLSLSTGAPLLVCPVYTTKDGWRCLLGKPIQVEPTGVMRDDVAALTRLMAVEFERAISGSPVDWHMFQPAWP